MGRSITEGLYTKPTKSHRRQRALSDDEVKSLKTTKSFIAFVVKHPKAGTTLVPRSMLPKVLAMKIIRSLRSFLPKKKKQTFLLKKHLSNQNSLALLIRRTLKSHLRCKTQRIVCNAGKVNLPKHIKSLTWVTEKHPLIKATPINRLV